MLKAACMTGALTLAVATFGASTADGQSLTIFHNNDGESRLLVSGDGVFGGFDHFLAELNTARQAAIGAGRDVLTLSSGDNILPGLTFTASEDRVGAFPAGSIDPLTQNYYDALALAAVGYDAITIGNHEFDAGPEVLADFIGGYMAAGGTAPFLSANLDFAGEPGLAALFSSAIAPSTVVDRGGNKYGIIGVTTPSITNISSPGNVTPTGPSLQDIANAVNAQVAVLQGLGVQNIILSGHLQSINEDQNLVPLLSGVDIIIAGGGDELLANAEDRNTTETFGVDIFGPYPLMSTTTDLDGKSIPLVTTQGEYRYVGVLNVEFSGGEVISLNGDPILVDPTASPTANGLFNGIDVQNDIMNPLQADVDVIAETIIGVTRVHLNGERDDIRSIETNLGNLVADAFLALEDDIVTDNVTIALTNSGGIRASIAVGNITVADIISVLPFNNSAAVIRDVDVATLVEALENSVLSVSGLAGGSGRFLQIAGFSFVYDQTNGQIVSVALEDGTPLFDAELGVVYQGKLDILTNSFTAGGGDSFAMFAALEDQTQDLGTLYADVLANFIAEDLSGLVVQSAYPISGESRIIAIPEPASLALLGMGTMLIISRLRRAA